MHSLLALQERFSVLDFSVLSSVLIAAAAAPSRGR